MHRYCTFIFALAGLFLFLQDIALHIHLAINRASRQSLLWWSDWL